jgi:MIP family channel proteins
LAAPALTERESLVSAKLVRPLVAEFVATALFVFFGAGSVVANAMTNKGLGMVGVAFANGLALAIGITMTMRISGGHLNPAVTVGLWVARKTDGRTAGAYILAQLTGAVLGAFLVKSLFAAGAVNVTNAGAPELANSVTFTQGIWLEALGAFFLVSAVFGTAVSSEAPAVGGFGVGLAVFVGALVLGPLTGAAFNPARALGPALVAGELHGQAVYWIGPLLGAAAAGLLWKFVLLPRDPARL